MADIPLRPLGNSGESVSALCLGGGHIGFTGMASSEAIRIVEHAIENGITFIDSAWEYHNGRSEALIGQAIRGRRDDVFLMTKVCSRERGGALEQLEDSLRRFGTDRIDLWQFHEVNYANDHEWIFAPGGAAEAGLEAVKSGKVRYLGFTGHKDPEFLLSMLEYDYPWTTCQLPINILDASFRSFVGRVVPELTKRGIGPLGMKSLGGEGQLVTSAGLSPDDCIRFALSQPISSLVSGMDSTKIVDQNVAIARKFTPMSDEDQSALVERTRGIASDGRYEWSKTTHRFDSKYHREQHGFPEKLVLG